jgi:hypothetical protein
MSPIPCFEVLFLPFVRRFAIRRLFWLLFQTLILRVVFRRWSWQRR